MALVNDNHLQASHYPIHDILELFCSVEVDHESIWLISTAYCYIAVVWHSGSGDLLVCDVRSSHSVLSIMDLFTCLFPRIFVLNFPIIFLPDFRTHSTIRLCIVLAGLLSTQEWCEVIFQSYSIWEVFAQYFFYCVAGSNKKLILLLYCIRLVYINQVKLFLPSVQFIKGYSPSDLSHKLELKIEIQEKKFRIL